MRTEDRKALPIVALVAALLLLALTGVAGAAINEAKDNGLYVFLRDWQTLIAALVALCAAYPVLRQLREMRKQSAASAVQMIVKAAVAIEDELQLLQKYIRLLARSRELLREYDEEDINNIYATWPRSAYDFANRAEKLSKKLLRYAERNPNGGQAQEARVRAIGALERLISSIRSLAYVIKAETSGPNYEYGEEDLKDGEAELRRTEADKAVIAWEEASSVLAAALGSDIARIWKRVRELEKIAIY